MHTLSVILPAAGSYEAIGWLVVGLAALCVAVNQMDDFFERRKPRAGFPPVEQLQESHHTLSERVDRLEASLAELRREMKEERLMQTQEASERVRGIYQRIEGVRAELAANQRSLPNEIVSLLKNTNAI